jgi:hypothetical protein
MKECGPCPVFASFTLAFVLQLRKKDGKTSVRVRKTSVRLRKTSVTVQYICIIKNTHTLQNPHKHTHYILKLTDIHRRSQWPRGLRRSSAAARLLRSWVSIPPGAWMFVCCECCVLSGTGLCDELITRPEESYRLWCVVVCNLEISRMRPWPALGRSTTARKKLIYIMALCFGQKHCNIRWIIDKRKRVLKFQC